MKKLTTLIFALLLTLSLAFSLTACNLPFGGGDDDDGDGEFVGELSEKEWKNAFDFENVTVKASIKMDGALSELYIKYFDGKEYMSGDGKNYVENENAGNYRLLFDFSEMQELFTTNDDGYVAERITLETPDGQFEPYNVRVSFNAKKRVSAVMFDAEIGSGMLASYTFAFSDYGKTDLQSGSSSGGSSSGGSSSGGMDISQSITEDGWRAAFDFDNVSGTNTSLAYEDNETFSYDFRVVNGAYYIIDSDGSAFSAPYSVIEKFIDFSDYFSMFSYSDGVFVADCFDFGYVDEFEYFTAKAFEIKVSIDDNGRISAIEYKYEQTDTESGEVSSFLYTYTFKDYDTTEAPELGGGKMSQDQWNMLFYFDNVTVSHYAYYGGSPALEAEKFFCNGYYYTSENGYEQQGLTSATAFMYNFTNHYELFSLVDGKYYAGELSVSFGDTEYVYYNVLVSVSDGRIIDMEFDRCTVGGDTVPTHCRVEFYDYGTTEAPENSGFENYMDITEDEWKALFGFNFDNATVTLILMTGGSENNAEYIFYKLVDGVEYAAENGYIYEESNSLFRNLELVNLSEFYSFFTRIEDGVYYAESFPLCEGSYTYYKDVCVSVDENGNLETVFYDITYFCSDGDFDKVDPADWKYIYVGISAYGTTEAPEIDSGSEEEAPITEDEWRAAFDFSNVTVEGWASLMGRTQSVILKFANEKVYVGYDGEEPTDGGDPLYYTPTFDFSAYFSEFTYDSDLELYYADSFNIQGHDVRDMYITLDENGKLESLCYYYDYQNAGYYDGMRYYNYTFYDYGTTVFEEDAELELRFRYSPLRYINLADYSDYDFFGEGEAVYSSFADYRSWEPGMTYVIYFSVYNDSPLTMNFTPYIDVFNIVNNYDSCIKYQVISNAKCGGGHSFESGEYISFGKNQLEVDATTIEPDSEYFFAIAFKMDETAGNEYMNGSFSFNIGVDSSLVEEEKDNFGPEYDE